jgi:serine phosphatase RsbU (regulator of sigma subunit)
MSNSARLLAVCDLLTEEQGHLDLRTVIDSAAKQLAGLTRSEIGIVAVDGPNGLAVGSYPRSVSDADVRQMFEAHRHGGPPQPLVSAAGAEARVAAFGNETAWFGIVAAAGPIDGEFSMLDDWLVSVVARRVESQLALVDLHQQRVADAATVRDAELAGKLQQALMPAAPHRSGAFDIAGRLHPARHVAGDLYDVLSVGDDAVAIVADVSGKGVPASLLTASLHTAAAHAVTAEGIRPAAVLSSIDRQIAPLLDRTGRIVTVAIAATDTRAGTIRIASAGHHPVLVRTAGTARLVTPGAPPLGIGSFQAPEAVVAAMPGDLVLLASDGIVDQRRPDGAEYGIDRLLGAVAGLNTAQAGDLVDAVFGGVEEFAAGAFQDDDQTAVVMTAVEDRR